MGSLRALEEIAKLEQRNAIKRGKFLTMFNTHAVQSLPRKEKEEFFNYLKKNKKTNLFLILSSFLLIITATVLRPELTGNVIFTKESTASSLSTIFIAIFAILIIIIVIMKLRKNSIKSKMKEHIRIADKAIR